MLYVQRDYSLEIMWSLMIVMMKMVLVVNI